MGKSKNNRIIRAKSIFDITDNMLCDIHDMMLAYEKYKDLPLGKSAKYHLTWAAAHIQKIFDASGQVLDKQTKREQKQ